MERVGIAADTDYLSELEAHFAAEVKAAAAGGVRGGRARVQPGLAKQLQEILFVELGLPKTKKIKTGYTTDADALQSLFAQTGHPVLAHLLRHRDVAKLKSTVDGLLKSVSDDGRIHTTFNQTVAATGRLSSTDPNLQNIPIRTEEGRRIRRAFVVGEGFEQLLTADYSQIEMRIMAHLSGDEALIDAFNSGADFHAATASSVFHVPVDEVVPEQRRKIKAMNYGLAYGLCAFGLSNQLGISTEEARGLMDGVLHPFRRGPRLSAVGGQARRAGRLHGHDPRPAAIPARPEQRQPAAPRDGRADGSQRPDPGFRRRHHQGRHAAGRRGAAGRRAGSRMLLQVHDELVFDVAPGERADLEALVRREMGAAYPLSVPLEVSVGVAATGTAPTTDGDPPGGRRADRLDPQRHVGGRRPIIGLPAAARRSAQRRLAETAQRGPGRFVDEDRRAGEVGVRAAGAPLSPDLLVTGRADLGARDSVLAQHEAGLEGSRDPVAQGAMLLDVAGHAGAVLLDVRAAVEVRVDRLEALLARLVEEDPAHRVGDREVPRAAGA